MARSSSFRYGLLLTLVFGPLLIAPNALGASGKKAKGEFGIMIGSLGDMDIKLTSKDSGNSAGDLEIDGGLSVGIFFEQKSFLGLWLGASIDYYQIDSRLDALSDDDPKTLGLALRISGRVRSADGRWILRPGISSGAVMLGEVGYLKTSQHVSIKPFIEVVHQASPKVGLAGEISIFSTVWGANDDYTILAGPTLLIRFGLVM